MNNPEEAIDLIFNSSASFEERCSRVFQFQAERNPFLKRFFEPFGLKPTSNPSPKEIPLMPIRAFKDRKIVVESEGNDPELIFKSSGTSEMSRSTHYILSRQFYETAILEEFKKYFPFDEYITLFYLPGYDQNPYSSLIWMAKYLVGSDPSGESQFVSLDELTEIDSLFQSNDKKILLFGAAFGLIDLAESGKIEPIDGLEILETGGMKTHRREMDKTELRQILSDGFEVPLNKIHSEYGMCELLSQMYSIGDEWFQTPHWVRVSVRDPKNPSRICDVGEEGKIGIIDLANIYSCPYILADDRGVMNSSGRFKVLGRWNPNDLRGCNFLIDNE